MRVAYADPPYPGQAKRHYRDHPDYRGEVDHRVLVDRLESEFPDGWALSTSVPALPAVLAQCPPLGSDMRVCVWLRSAGSPFPPCRVMWTWEPLLVRIPHWRQRHPHDFVRDTLVASQPHGFLGNEITGQKPVAFCHWVFNLLGLGPEDELADLFPGSGAVGHAWDAWRRQLSLFDEVTPGIAVASWSG